MSRENQLNYGNDFLNKLLTSLLLDEKFLLKCSFIMKPKYVQSDGQRWLFQKIIQYYKEYRTTATLDSLKVQILSIRQVQLRNSVSIAFQGMLQELDATDLQFVKDKTISFCKFQELKQAILKSAQLLKLQNYQKISTIINHAMIIGQDPGVGSEYVESLEDRYNEFDKHIIPTPWEPINNLLFGGLGAGQLGIILAPPNTGKSWALQNLAVGALSNNKKVLFYTLQMSEIEVGQRIDVLFNKKTRMQNHLKSEKENILQSIKKFKDLLFIKQFLPNHTTIQDLKNHVKLLQLYSNFKPDLIIIDYGDIIKKEVHGDNMYASYGDIFTNLKAWAKQANIPIWTGTQGNRSSNHSDIVTSENVAHSYGKIEIADFVMSMSVKLQDLINNTARIHIAKNRGGRRGQTFNAYIDLDLGIIDIQHQDSRKSMQLQAKMDSSKQVIRKTIRQRLKTLSMIENQQKGEM